jgi:hypothetical protein
VESAPILARVAVLVNDPLKYQRQTSETVLAGPARLDLHPTQIYRGRITELAEHLTGLANQIKKQNQDSPHRAMAGSPKNRHLAALYARRRVAGSFPRVTLVRLGRHLYTTSAV